MSAFPLSETAPRVLAGEAVQWRTPLAAADAETALERLGAERPHGGEAAGPLLLSAADDPFCASLRFVVKSVDGGTVVRVSVLERGFAADFDVVVRGGLTVFALLLLAHAASVVIGHDLLRAAAAIGLGWSTLMGVYTGLRWLMTSLGGHQRALDEACGRAARALFAQRG
jgi:hypothetical protein